MYAWLVLGMTSSETSLTFFEYWKSGFTHICITDPDIEGLCKKISETGGKQRSKVWEIVPDKGYKIDFL